MFCYAEKRDYWVLGVETATAEIKKAYRKKAFVYPIEPGDKEPRRFRRPGGLECF